jgi:single-strand DNA-binding protein
MSSVNKVIIVGRLGKDPEIKHMQSGDDLANLSVATSESWKDKSSGEWKDKTEWHRIVIFNQFMVKAAQRIKKGALVYVEGQLQTRKWTDQQGNERFSTEVVLSKFSGILTLLDKPPDQQERRQDDGPAQPRGRTQADLDDEIPF